MFIQQRETPQGRLQPVLLGVDGVSSFNHVKCVGVTRILASVWLGKVHDLAVNEHAGAFLHFHRQERWPLVDGRRFVVDQKLRGAWVLVPQVSSVNTARVRSWGDPEATVLPRGVVQCYPIADHTHWIRVEIRCVLMCDYCNSWIIKLLFFLFCRVVCFTFWSDSGVLVDVHRLTNRWLPVLELKSHLFDFLVKGVPSERWV